MLLPLAMTPTERPTLIEQFRAVRRRTESLAAALSPEDQQLQAYPDASPTKWHRGHTTWFFETFVLAPHGVPPEEPRWGVVFNSYYEAVGARVPRPQRGLLSRPTTAEIGAWRARVDDRVTLLLERAGEDTFLALVPLVRLGIAHEEQHQELILTDLLAAFAANPLQPTYAPLADAGVSALELRFVEHGGGRVALGREQAFAFDNEGPVHEVLLPPFALANRLVTVGEWRSFAADRGYQTPSLWLSDGLAFVRSQALDAPAYTRLVDGEVVVYGLHGERVADPAEPVTHLSLYEADALATWLGGRLPTEAEWELGAAGRDDLRPDTRDFVPRGTDGGWFGSVWQWTRSAYGPYPGYRAAAGAIGEYNGKFMINQAVLRGSSVFTPPGHSRPTYRNFWPPGTRFQATGLRVARDLTRDR